MPKGCNPLKPRGISPQVLRPLHLAFVPSSDNWTAPPIGGGIGKHQVPLAFYFFILVLSILCIIEVAEIVRRMHLKEIQTHEVNT